MRRAEPRGAQLRFLPSLMPWYSVQPIQEYMTTTTMAAKKMRMYMPTPTYAAPLRDWGDGGGARTSSSSSSSSSSARIATNDVSQTSRLKTVLLGAANIVSLCAALLELAPQQLDRLATTR